jgi:C-terminal processing protease CtpA/Prc
MMNDNISDELKIYELSLIWKEAEYNFAFWEWLSGSLDWDSAYKSALPAVLKTKNLYEYYLELMKFVSLLRDAHTCVWFPKSIEDSPYYTSKLPIITKLIGGERIITNVKRVAADKVKQWSVIKKVNGINMDEYAVQNIYPYIWHEKKDSSDFWIDRFFRNGSVGSSVELELENDGKIETVSLTRSKEDTDWFYDSLKLKLNESLRKEYKSDSHQISITEDGIAVITIDTMMNNNLPDEFYANFPLLEKARGYIIDIRNNGGGNSAHSDAVAAAFIGGRFINQRALHPIHIGAYKAWGYGMQLANKTYEQVVAERGSSDWMEKTYKITHRQYYEDYTSDSNRYNCPGVLTKPLVVLASPGTASAAEDFLIELDFNKRATIVGSASFGSTGNPLTMELESGGGFQICTRHHLYPDGREIVNMGVKPHIPFEMTLDDYKNGDDSVMKKGLEELRKLIKDNTR